MNYIGIDIGSTASKVAVKGDHDLHFVLPTGWSSKETCQTIKDRLLEDGIDVLSNDSKVVATGYGRVAVDFADHVITEITCHAKSVNQKLQITKGFYESRFSNNTSRKLFIICTCFIVFLFLISRT